MPRIPHEGDLLLFEETKNRRSRLDPILRIDGRASGKERRSEPACTTEARNGGIDRGKGVQPDEEGCYSDQHCPRKGDRRTSVDQVLEQWTCTLLPFILTSFTYLFGIALSSRFRRLPRRTEYQPRASQVPERHAATPHGNRDTRVTEMCVNQKTLDLAC